MKAGTGKRRLAREMAVQMLYQHEVGGAELQEIFTLFSAEGYPTLEERSPRDDQTLPEAFDYACRLVTGVHRHGEQLDRLIQRQAENWRLERMPVTDRNVLRLAFYEMLYEESIPKVVIVDEAIDLAKRFGSENSGRFVNGLLDGYLKSLPAAESTA